VSVSVSQSVSECECVSQSVRVSMSVSVSQSVIELSAYPRQWCARWVHWSQRRKPLRGHRNRRGEMGCREVLVSVLTGSTSRDEAAQEALCWHWLAFIRESGDCVVGEVAISDWLRQVSAEGEPGGSSIESFQQHSRVPYRGHNATERAQQSMWGMWDTWADWRNSRGTTWHTTAQDSTYDWNS
jgi:hypothetical protein